MSYQDLKTLAESYPPLEREALTALAQEYRSRNERGILEIAAIATDVSLDSVLNLRIEPEANPQFMEAFRLQYPNVDIASLSGASEEQLNGLFNGVKGKYFEVLVRDRLNAGEQVGELELEPGQVARLAESSTQPGWDLRIENEDGTVAELLQLKATDSMSYVKEALERYPDIRVVTPTEVDNAAVSIVGTDISDGQLELFTRTQMDEIGESGVVDLLDKSAELAFDSIPFVSMVTSGVIEGRNYLTGRYALRESLRRGAERIGQAAVYDAIGTALGPIGAPVVVSLRAAHMRIAGRIALGDHLESRTMEIRLLNFRC